MSYQYRGSSKDLKSPPGRFSSSEPPHLREHDAYRTSRDSSTRTVSSFTSSRSALESYCSQRSSTVENALSLLASCGLDPEDLSLLAGMPDNMITVETLPRLLMEIKEKKAGENSARSVSCSSNSPTVDARRGSTGFRSEAKPSCRPSYPTSEESTEDWQDRWDTPTQSSFVLQDPVHSKSSYVVDYNYGHSRDEQANNYENPPSSMRAGNCGDRISDYHRTDRSTRPGGGWNTGNYWEEDNAQRERSGHRESPVENQRVDRSTKADREPLASYWGKDQMTRVGKNYEPEVDYQGVDSRARVKMSHEHLGNYQSLGRHSRPVNSRENSSDYQSADRIARARNSCEHLVNYQDVDGVSRAGNSREPLVNYQGGDRVSRTGNSHERLVDYKGVDRDRRGEINQEPSTDYRRLEGSTRSGYSQESSTGRWEIERNGALIMSSTKKADILPSHPSKQEADEFHGVMPQGFPYACSLCDIAVLSERDWTSHINGSQHADSQLRLLQMYPNWDCRSDSSKGGQRQSGSKRAVEKVERNWHGVTQPAGAKCSSGEKCQLVKDVERSKVICVKFPPDSVDEINLMKLVQPFGTVVNISIFPTKAFVEMKTCLQAEDTLKFYSKNPAMVHGSQVHFSLSTALTFPQSSRVVCFSRLPPGKEKNTELIAMAKRFGQVKHSLFLPNRVLVEMTNKEGADKLVGHYASHPLKIKGKNILVSYSTEYSTLKEESPDTNSEKSKKSNQLNRRRSPSPRRRSPSPRIKSSEMEDSSSDSPTTSSTLPPPSKVETPADSVKETPVEVEGNESVTQELASCLASGSTHSPGGDQGSSQGQAPCHEENQEGHGESADLDSDIEGMEVIGEDEEEMELEGSSAMEVVRPTGETSEEAMAGPLESEPSASVAIQPYEKETTDIRTESLASPGLQAEDEPSDAPSTSGQQEQVASEEEEPDFPQSLEQCIILDELEDEDEEIRGDTKSMPEAEEVAGASGVAEQIPNDETEELFNGRVIYIKNLPKLYYTDSQFVKIVKGFGMVKRYFLIRTRQEGFIEMETPEDAQRVAKELALKQTEIRGCPLTIQLSRKYQTLTTGWSPEPDSEEEGEGKSESKREEPGHAGLQSQCMAVQEELPAKRLCIREEGPTAPCEQQQQGDSREGPSSQKEVYIKTEESETKASQDSDSSDDGKDTQEKPSHDNPLSSPRDRVEQVAQEDKAEDKVEPTADHAADRLGPFQPHAPVGQEFVHPIMAYICSLCSAIYASEEEAKHNHCASHSHYQKLKAHLEQSGPSELPTSTENLPK